MHDNCVVPVQHEHLRISFHFCQVDWHIEGTNDAMVSVGDGILDVVGGGVNENTLIIPSTRLHTSVFLNSAKYFHFLVTNRDAVLGK